MNLLRLVMIVLLVLTASGSRAQSQLVIEKTDGSRTVFRLSEKPTVTLAGDGFQVKSNLLETNFLRAEVVKFYFEAEETGVKQADRNSCRISCTDDWKWMVEGYEENVKICEVSGREVNVKAERTGKVQRLDLSRLPKGVYLLVLPQKQSVKIYKK